MRSHRVAAIAVPAVLLILTVCACGVASGEENPFVSLHVVTSRSRYAGPCPVGVTFTGRITFAMPHPRGFVFNYHWERSDGAKGPVQVVRPPAGEGAMTVKDHWELGARGQQYNVSETLVVNSGNTHLSESSPTVPIVCR
ncbi:MAG TPA: hypothetical protein VMT19_04530 [Thermoanaerobaculaceae bacterium]|nr:hypothetical protein [Thermoanaerobaculaceae bacterium]